MTESYGLFDAADPEAPDRVYSSEAFARLFRTIMRDGTVHNDGDELAVSPTVPAAMSVDVGTGMALVQGRYLINDAALTLAVEAADPSYPRIDRVVVRADLVGRTVHAVVKKGTAAASPVAPALTRTAETWELSLAQVRVEAGATSIVAAKITDERANTSLCGVAAPVYVPSSQLEVVGAVDMQGKALTGLPAPSGSVDAARKGYVDAEIAGKIGGFGISQVAIDANKDWGGKSITNVGSIQTLTGNVGALSQFVDVPGTTVRKNVNISESVSSTWKTLYTITVPPTYSSIPMSSNLRASITNAAPGVSGPSPVLKVQVLRDGEVIGTASIGGWATSVTASVDTTGGFCAGNTLVIQGSWSDNVTNAVTITNVKILSNRSTITPATKVFDEAGSW